MKEERIGVEFTTNEGYQVIVIDYINAHKIQVMFLDEHKFKTWTEWNSLKCGRLKNPFHKSVCGVGYLGVDKNGEKPIPKEKIREYECWSNMIKRCYDKKVREKYPTYKNCTVSEEWHDFSKFLEDLPKIKNYELWRDNPQQKISLNKDIYYAELGIIADCKEYNLLTTRFITDKENTRERMERQGNPNPPKKVRCIETGVIYESVLDVEKKTGLDKSSISKVCRGLMKTCGKLHWEYVE